MYRFPENPEINDIDTVGKDIYVWDGEKWVKQYKGPEKTTFSAVEPVRVKKEYLDELNEDNDDY